MTPGDLRTLAITAAFSPDAEYLHSTAVLHRYVRYATESKRDDVQPAWRHLASS